MWLGSSCEDRLEAGQPQQLLHQGIERDMSKVNLRSPCRGSDQNDVASSE